MNIHVLLLDVASLITPRRLRGEWLAEWVAELHYVARRNQRAATRFCMGAFADALWIRRNEPHPWRLRSPFACGLWLICVAAITVFSGLHRATVLLPLPAVPLFLAISMFLLTSSITLSRGEYPKAYRTRCWSFLVFKISLIVAIVFFGTLNIGALVAPRIQPHGLMVGFILGLRWAFLDQHRRCPVCLHCMEHPASIGNSSYQLLEWYGTELACPNGHGLLYVPGIAKTSFSQQRWIKLDSSWRALFALREPQC